MANIELLKDLYYEEFNIDLSSGVFKELLTPYPNVTVWLKDNEVRITSTRDFNTYNYYGENGIKIYETNDYGEIIVLYKITGFKYIYDKEEILDNLILFLENRKSLRLVDNKNTNKYNY